MLHEPVSMSVFRSAVFKGGFCFLAKLSCCLACMVLVSFAAIAQPPAYPTDVKPYQIIVFEQPDFVGSYRVFTIFPGFCMAPVHKLDAFKDNIRSVMVGDKVGVTFYVEEDFRGSHANVRNSTGDFKQLPSEIPQTLRIEHKIKSLVVYLRENAAPHGVSLIGRYGESQFFPANASGKGTASYPQIAFNDKALSLSLSPSYDSILSVELYENKDFKGDWIRLPGATESSNNSSYRLKDYNFDKKASSLKISYLKPAQARPEHEPEAGASGLKPLPVHAPGILPVPAEAPATGALQAIKPLPAQAQPLRPAMPAGGQASPTSTVKPASPLKPVMLPNAQVPSAQGSIAEGSLRFNPATLEVSEFKGGWAIMDSTDPKRITISFFKQDRKGDAEQALRVLQHYGMNQKEVLGDSGFAFFLVSGKAPEGDFPGEKCQVFDPQAITVEQRSITSKTNPGQVTGSYWAIMSGPKQLWAFRDDEQRAREARMFIRQYDFTRLCSIGGFVYWRK
jgi:hypothetical protein